MRICFVGLDNLPVLAHEYCRHSIGGESVQQTLLARAMARRGHAVSMVAADYGQEDGAQWDQIRVYKAYAPEAGIPVLRFVHPRWTGLWSALKRADADLYYTSCAGMQVGLIALFCERYGKRFVFRAASDSDCDPARLLIRYARDRWLYEFGLRRADAILVQSEWQAEALSRNYGLASHVAGMLVESPHQRTTRDIPVLWVNNVRQLKRPDRILGLADRMPQVEVHIAGGSLPNEEALFQATAKAASARRNVVFHGRLPYSDAKSLYDRAKVFVNTSEVEGFPNSYLQAWIRGVPVVTLIDPDGVIEREGLGRVVSDPAMLADAVAALLEDRAAWQAASDRCRAYMARKFNEDQLLEDYLETFDGVMRRSRRTAAATMRRRESHA